VRLALEPAVPTSAGEAIGDDGRVSVENYRQVGSVGSFIEVPDRVQPQAIHALENKAGWDVSVRDNNRSGGK
jgi:hypothetical protein